jgi:hypothetical protein
LRLTSMSSMGSSIKVATRPQHRNRGWGLRRTPRPRCRGASTICAASELSEEDVAKDVEKGLSAPSQRRLRAAVAVQHQGAQHDDPADGQHPDRGRRP